MMTRIIRSYHAYITGILLALGAFGLFFLFPALAQAAAYTPPGTCTNDAAFTYPHGLNIVSQITQQLNCILFGCPGITGVGQVLYVAITNSFGFNQLVRVALVLYIIFYGISFTLGMVQLTVLDFVNRMIKFGLMLYFLSPTSWGIFSVTVGQFFNEGTIWLINGIGGIVGSNDPFSVFDIAIGQTLSARMFVTLIAIFFSGPYGLIIGILLLMSLGTFVGAILQAVWVFLMSMVVRAFLFGLAPIFICCLLFSRTRHLFDGWLNQLVNATLQPVFLCTFFAFFAQLVLNAMNQILAVEVCYMPSQGLFRGTSFDMVMPRFTRNGQPYGGPIGWNDPFPVSIFDVLTFLLLTQLTWRFNGIVLNIAKEISAASTNLNMQGALGSMMNPGGIFQREASKAANQAARGLGGRGRTSVAQQARDNIDANITNR
jgi:type IV secretory pathway VirB6-like protein